MKKILLSMMAVMGISFFAAAQAVGDYRSVGGAWGTLASWERLNALPNTWATPTPGQGFPGQNAVPGTVTILDGDAITLDVSPTNNLGTLVIQGGGNASTLTLSSGFLLTVNGAVTINAGTGNGDDKRISVDGATLTCGSITMAVTTNDNRDCRVRIQSGGTVNVSGNITMADGDIDRNYIRFDNANAGTLNVGGNITGGAIIRNSGTTTYTVNFNGSGAQTIPVNGTNYVYHDLTINNTNTATGASLQAALGATTLFNNVTVGNINSASLFNIANFNLAFGTGTRTLTVAAGSTMAAGTGQVSFGAAAGTVLINGTYRTADADGFSGATTTAINTTTNTPTLTLGANSTIEYNGGTQTVTDRNYSNLTISNANTKTWTLGAARTVSGNLTISANAPFTLAGGNTLSITGNWIKNSTAAFTPGTTVVNFNGSAVQDIGGSQPTTFGAVTINNSSVAGVTLSRDITVTGVMTLTDGVVNTASSNGLLLITSTGTIPGGGSTASHIDGPVQKTGNSGFIFPVGDAGIFSPLTISAPNEAGDAFLAEYRRASATALGAITSPGLLNVSNCEYWVLNEVADPSNNNSINITVGWFSNSGCGTGNYVTQPSSITIAHFGTSWDSHSGVGAGTPVTGTVTRNAVTVFSPFALGNIAGDQNPLPVTFADVKAFEKGSAVQIEWSNLTEKDVVNYIVERSANGNDFVAIGQLNARSNQTDKQNYVSLDAAPIAGTNFYRIKVVELDGKVIYSKMLRVDIGKTVKGITLYPNPVTSGEVTIGFAAVKGLYTLRIMNAAGQQVSAKQIVHPGGNVSQAVTIPASVKAGFYVMMISGENFKESKTFVIQ